MGKRAKYPHPVFGWNAAKLTDLSFAALDELRLVVEASGKNPQANSLYIYSKAARRKLDALAWAVTIKLDEKRRSAA